jgi:hypothetical protein
MFEKRAQRRIFGSERDRGTAGWSRLHDEPHNLYSSLNTSRMGKSRRRRWPGMWYVLGRSEVRKKIMA